MNTAGEYIASMGFHFPTEAEMKAREQAESEEALAYLHSKGWADATPDNIGARNYALARDILNAKRWEAACEKCRQTGERGCRVGQVIPVVCREDFQGRTIYTVRYGHCPTESAKEASKSDFDRLLEYSGLTEKQRGQTFDAYEVKGLGADIRRAKGAAWLAAQEGDWLILAGQRGTGKSHLAVAIMLYVMTKHGQQAYFRLTSEMLDGLRESFREEKRTYEMLMQSLKEVPCLVLDDLGKERYTEAGCDFLYQIIDARYREKRQTIITTNAASRDELVSWGRPDILVPILSRMDEMGNWICIERAEDYRVKIGDSKARREGAAV